MWLAIQNRCWTTDKLAKRNLPHPEKCTLCDHEEKTAQHILVGCAFARVFLVQSAFPFRLSASVPKPSDQLFVEWWRSRQVPKDKKKCFNSVVILGAWDLWKHRIQRRMPSLGPSRRSRAAVLRGECHRGLDCFVIFCSQVSPILEFP
jgi:hypothetical protein